MFKSIKETDGLKIEQTHYYLTQGDSCTITSTPYKNGEIATGVTKCVFKLATSDYKLVKEVNMSAGSNGSYILNLTSAETSSLSAGSYIYEIEYTIGNEVQTPHSWKFDIVKQITE